VKVAYLCNRYPAISNTFILREVRALRRLGVEVHTLTVRRPAREHLLAAADREEDARTWAVLPAGPGRLLAAHRAALAHDPRRYLATLRLAWRLSAPGARAHLWQLFYFAEAALVWAECRRRGVRHLHAHFTDVASDDALLAAHLGGWSWSFTVHGPVELANVARHRLAEKAARADAVVCVSDFCRSQLMTLVAEERWSRLRLVRCGVDPGAFAPNGGPPPGRRELELLCVGRLVAVKGHVVLLDALAELRARGVPLRATLVGDGPERAALTAHAVRLGLGHAVAFAGAVGQDAIRAHYARADVVCMPSFAEGLPVVLMEAMAMAIPVVATWIAGVPELVRDGHSGLLVAPGRPDELAGAIERLARDPELRRRLGRAGRERVLEEFDVGRSVRVLRRVLAEAGAA